MIHKRIDIWGENEYTYEAAYGFKPNLRTYLHEDDIVRPAMIVVPGGGYCMVCNIEGEPVAKEFYDRGMNVFVLTYTTDITTSFPLRTQPMRDLSRAVRYVRANAFEFKIKPDKLIVCGFSAGGHVCGSLAVHCSELTDSVYGDVSNRPDAVIMGYPVVTFGQYTHEYSVISLLGHNASSEELRYFSLEKQVSPSTPPTFLWQTVEDDLVPIENTQLMAQSLRAQGVPYAYYAFPHGRHGLSAANDAVRRGEFGEPYTFEQLDAAVDNVRKGTAINLSETRRQEILEQFATVPQQTQKETNSDSSSNSNSDSNAVFVMPKFDDVALWPTLAEHWLRSMGIYDS